MPRSFPFILLFACADPATGTDDTSLLPGADTADDTGNRAQGTATIEATVTTVDGAPPAGLRVQYCRGILCITPTDEDTSAHVYTFRNLPAGGGFFEVVAPRNSGFATVGAPFAIEDDAAEVLTVTMPALGEPASLPTTREPLTLAPGLSVIASASDFPAASPLDPNVDALAAAAATDFGIPVDDPSTLVAVWHIEPYDLPAASPVGVSVDLEALGATDAFDDADAVLYVSDVEGGLWTRLGTLNREGDVLSDDAILTRTGTVLLRAEPTED